MKDKILEMIKVIKEVKKEKEISDLKKRVKKLENDKKKNLVEKVIDREKEEFLFGD